MKRNDRYDSSIVQNQLKELLPKSSIQDFLETAEIKWIEHKFRGDDTKYEIVKCSDLRDAYSKYMGNSRFKLSNVNFIEELKQYGIERLDKPVKIHGITTTIYRRVKQDEPNDLEEIAYYNGIELN